MTEMGKHGQFAIIPARALDDSRFIDKDNHLKALMILGTYADKNGWCYPSLSTVAEWMMISRSTLSEIYHDLQDWGYIIILSHKTEDGVNDVNKYRVIHDATLPDEFDRTNPNHPIRKEYNERKQRVRQARLTKKQGVRQASVDSEQGVREPLEEIGTNAPLNVPSNVVSPNGDERSHSDLPIHDETEKPNAESIAYEKPSDDSTPKGDSAAEYKKRLAVAMAAFDGTRAGAADPQIEQAEIEKRYAQEFYAVLGYTEDAPKELTTAAHKMLQSKWYKDNRRVVDERLKAYRNGEGKQFRKPDASVWFILTQLQRDIAAGKGKRKTLVMST